MAGNSHKEIANFIWDICNLLRGPYKRNEYRKVILPLTVLRRFDATLEPTKAAVLKEFDGLKGKSETIVMARLKEVTGVPFYNLSRMTFNLEELRSFGWKVFHDLEFEYAKGKKANIDHIVVAPQGVFLIETKTVAKIEGDNEKMTFDGKQIIFQKSGKTISLPVAQMEASAKYLQHFFFQRLGLKIDIKQIVVYPGWFMDWTREGAIPHAPIWACPPCYVRSRIQYEKEPVLNQTDFERVCNELESANRI